MRGLLLAERNSVGLDSFYGLGFSFSLGLEKRFIRYMNRVYDPSWCLLDDEENNREGGGKNHPLTSEKW